MQREFLLQYLFRRPGNTVLNIAEEVFKKVVDLNDQVDIVTFKWYFLNFEKPQNCYNKSRKKVVFSAREAWFHLFQPEHDDDDNCNATEKRATLPFPSSSYE